MLEESKAFGGFSANDVQAARKDPVGNILSVLETS